MGDLHEFNSFLIGRRKKLSQAESKLVRLQEKYEQFFGEVARVRESEYQQLRAHIVGETAALPDELKRSLDAAQRQARETFDAKVRALAEEIEALASTAEATRQESLRAEVAIHTDNKDLDQQEETLKEKSAALLAKIDAYNKEIDSLGKGFGFFKNFFQMRRLQRLRHQLDEEQAGLAARIDQLRQLWHDWEKNHGSEERDLQRRWVEHQTEAAALEAKLEHLRGARDQVVERTAIEQVLYAYRPRLQAPTAQDPPCPRCGKPNPEQHHFCYVCAQRLQPDRPDLAGSLVEIAELNHHHDNFSEGMRACQEIIGLVRGLISGHDSFKESVDDMINTQEVHPVSTLSIEVPGESIAYGRNFDALADAIDPLASHHPSAFAEEVQRVIADVYTEDKIKGYFETMGEELSKEADAQW